MDFLGLDPLLRAALQEDLGHGDLTTDAILRAGATLRPPRSVTARVLARAREQEKLVLAGWPVFLRVFQLLGTVDSQLYGEEGGIVAGEIGLLRADASVILKGERVALNLLQRLSGIATMTRRYVELVEGSGARILDTRKTTPLWRNLEKYAVRLGGGFNHRFGLDDGILIKENHVTLAGGIREAVQLCRQRAGHLQKVEVEVRGLAELREALAAGADAVLLDNMTPEQVREAVQLAAGRSLLEASGGIDESNIVEYAQTGVNFISLGALTHSFRSADVSLLVEGS